jgi:hypothetical protein
MEIEFFQKDFAYNQSKKHQQKTRLIMEEKIGSVFRSGEVGNDLEKEKGENPRPQKVVKKDSRQNFLRTVHFEKAHQDQSKILQDIVSLVMDEDVVD